MASRPRRKGFLIVIAACSGTGKSTVCRALLERDASMRVSVSYTTRAPRGQEEDGVHYHFVSPDAFQEMVTGGEFLEWAQVHDRAYGTGRAATEALLDQGHDVLLDIDVQGAFQIRETFGERSLLIFLLPPDWSTLRTRLEGRGTETEEQILRRLETAREELERARKMKYLVVNDEVSEAAQAILEIRNARAAETRFCGELLQTLCKESQA